jgi:hypothetical protein
VAVSRVRVDAAIFAGTVVDGASFEVGLVIVLLAIAASSSD